MYVRVFMNQIEKRQQRPKSNCGKFDDYPLTSPLSILLCIGMKWHI